MIDDRFKKELYENKICSEFTDQGQDIPVRSIVKYLTEYCPDSCFATNYKNNYPFDDYDEELYSYFRYEVLHWCGCRSPEEADQEVSKYLELIDNSTKTSTNFIEDPVGWSKEMKGCK